MNNENRPYLALIAILLVGAIAGFLVKAALKAKVTSSPDDRRITAVKQMFDFKAAQDNADKQEQALQEEQQVQGAPSGAPGEEAVPSDQDVAPVPGQ